MKFKIKKFLLVSVLIGIILFSMCPQVFATNGNEMSISSKEGIGNTVEIISGNTNSIKSESVVDVVSYLSGQNITVNSITNHKGASVDLTSTALIGTGYVLDTNNGNYSVIVYGDANGDGEVDAGDMKVVIDDFLGIKQASPIAKLAVDVYQDGNLDAADLKLTLDSFLGNLKGSILNNTNAPTPTPTPVPTTVNSEPTIMVGSQIVTLTKSNAPEYYGQVVTNYSATNSATWRLFYVDFDGKYGDKGTIYLKADPIELSTAAGRTTLDITSSVNSSSALNIMKKMNAKWAQNDGTVNENKEKAVIWLCDDSKWNNYKNSEKANYAIGTPSVEMFLDSYNQYHAKNGTSGYQQIQYTWINQAGGGYGYIYKNNQVVGEECIIADNNNMYSVESNCFLASPTFENFIEYGDNINKDCVVGVTYLSRDGENWIYGYAYSGEFDVCPVVSIKSGVIPEIQSTNLAPTPTPTQATENFSTPYNIVFDVCDANDSRIKYSGVNLVIALYDGEEVSSMYQMMTDADGKCIIPNVTTVGKIGISTKNGYDTANNTYVKLATNKTTGKIYLAGANNIGTVSMAGNQLTIQVLVTQQ